MLLDEASASGLDALACQPTCARPTAFTPPGAHIAFHIAFSQNRTLDQQRLTTTTAHPTAMRALLCFLLCLVAHASAGRIAPASRPPAQRLRGNQQPRTMTLDDRRVPRSGRVSLVATRRRGGDDRAPKASNTACRGGPQRATRERMAEPPPRGADYHGCPRRRSGGMQCDTPSDSGMLACSF